jgi:hypothetical protein
MVASSPFDIASHFGTLKDPRFKHSPLHALIEIIVIALCAIICGANDWVAVEAWGKAKEEWLGQYLRLPNGIPSHDTFGRVFGALDPDEFRRCFISWAQSICHLLPGEVVPIDGKCLRHSYDNKQGKSAIHMVSAWANEARVVLGQVKVDEKSNEITAIPVLLNLLALKGCIVTIDAMGCQTNIAQTIVDNEADYTLAVKKNQKTLYKAIQSLFADGLRVGHNIMGRHKGGDWGKKS